MILPIFAGYFLNRGEAEVIFEFSRGLYPWYRPRKKWIRTAKWKQNYKESKAV
jgi:hypothetical protein